MRLKPYETNDVPEPSPVKHIKPPNRTEPAESATIATILLRRAYELFEYPGKDKDKVAAFKLWAKTQERKLTEEEAKRAIALVAVIKGDA